MKGAQLEILADANITAQTQLIRYLCTLLFGQKLGIPGSLSVKVIRCSLAVVQLGQMPVDY